MSNENKDLKYLDNNDYERIIIIEDKLNTSYSLNISKTNEKREEQLPLESICFSDKLKGLSETQKIEQIIYYFLQSNEITSISKNYRISNYPYLFNLVEGDNVSLATRLFCDKKILSDCANKYEFDRYEFLNKNKDVICYEMFTSENTSSYTEEKYFGQKVIQLTLIKHEEKLWWKDEKFLKIWILQKLEEQGLSAEYIDLLDYSKENNVDTLDIPKLVCGSLVIYLPDKLLQKNVKQIVREYNKSVEKQKRKQLKLEVL